MEKLIFLKLGGSLITDKEAPRTAREELILSLSKEIAQIIQQDSSYRLILGHGSGSFGHYSGKKHRTREGVSTKAEWKGFAEVKHDAAMLNQIVMDGLRDAGVAAIAFPPSASIIANNRTITKWDLSFITSALENNLLPVVYGDVVFDSTLGGTILSTEELFLYLARELNPVRILLAGIDRGVWEDYPTCTKLIKEITPSNYPSLLDNISSSSAPDVTGGMAAKVNQMLELIQDFPELSIQVFSGMEPGNITKTLSGEILGTMING